MKRILFFLFLLLGVVSGSSTAHEHIRHHRTVNEDEASSCDSGLPQSDENISMQISHDGSYGSVDGIQRVLDPVDLEIIRILVAHLEILRKGILKLKKEFNSNDIVKESLFLNLIYSLITTDIDIDGFFESGLVWPDKKQQQEKLFELLKKLIEMGIQLEENEKTRKSLQAALDASNDGLKKFQEYMDEPDIKKFLLDWVKERFQEGIKDGLKKWLEKKIGEKATGMLFNSLKRLYDAISLSSTIERKNELAREFNELLLLLLEILEGMEDPEGWDFSMEFNQELEPYGRWAFPDFYKGYARIEPRFNYFIPGDEEQGTQDQWSAIKVPFHIKNKKGELKLKSEYEIEDLNKVDGTVIEDGKIIVPLPMIIVPGPGKIPQDATHMFMELYIESRTEDNKNKNKPDEKVRVIIGVKIPKPMTLRPTSTPTETPSDMPSANPTDQPSTEYPTTESPTTRSPSDQPSPFPSTAQPSTDPPSPFPTTVQQSPSIPPTTAPPSTGPPTNTPPPTSYAPNLIV